MKRTYKSVLSVISALLCVLLVFSSCDMGVGLDGCPTTKPPTTVNTDDFPEKLPEYTGNPYIDVHGGKAEFPSLGTDSFEEYSDLDKLGRCGVAESCIGIELMPTEERKSIGQVKPSGWQLAKYDFVDGKFLYNRCHLIGYQLTAENANVKNLITGTRYLNTEGMLPFEDKVAEYVKSTKNHVMYRVEPIFEGDNLVASGVWIMAKSSEDDGKGIDFNVYCFNVEPGVTIDYSDGTNRASGEISTEATTQPKKITYILNKGTKKIHLPTCESVENMKPQNKEKSTDSLETLKSRGYEPCNRCLPKS